MAAYEIEFTATAERAFRKLPDEVQRRFSRALKLLRQDPRRRRPGCDVRLLSGAATAWRLRVGDYRGDLRDRRAQDCLHEIRTPRERVPAIGSDRLGRQEVRDETPKELYGFSIGVLTIFPHSVQDPS